MSAQVNDVSAHRAQDAVVLIAEVAHLTAELAELTAEIAHVAVRAAGQDPSRGSVLLGPAQARPQRRDVGLQRIDPLVALLRLAHIPDVTGAATARGPVREI
jgi:hypothetical protein